MAGPKLSEAVRAILDATRVVEADVEFTKEEAELLYGASKAGKLSDLTDSQLLQYCLLSAHGSIQTLTETLNSVPNLNREQRRALEKKSR